MSYRCATIGLIALIVFWLAIGGIVAAVEDQPRTAFFVSDLHLGVGEILPGKYARQEDFRWHAEFSQWLDHIDRSTASNAELVLLGDTFELWQSPFQICRGDGATFACETLDCRANGPALACSADEALARVTHVLRQHRQTVEALRAFAHKGQNRLTIVPGNHDAALLLPVVQRSVLAAFGDPVEERIAIARSGYWVSTDSRIYADHGHMFDKVNRYATWPTPFETRAGRVLMQEPWGERMVQQFYNQYEEILPIIDNLDDELEGARMATNVLSAAAVTVAVKRFLAFLVFDTTLGQKIAFLGEESGHGDDPAMLGTKAQAEIAWDQRTIRQGDSTAFLIESMPLDALRANAQAAGVVTTWDDISNEQVAELCEQRQVLIEYYTKRPEERFPPDSTIAPCPRSGGENIVLGYVADKFLKREAANRRTFLETVGGRLGRKFDLYVYGHTHAATSPFRQKIDELWTVGIVNDGAFQRVVSVDQIKNLAGSGKSVAEVFAHLEPEDLRPCYAYVRVKPYSAVAGPTAELRWWARVGAQWLDRDSCPPWPVRR